MIRKLWREKETGKEYVVLGHFVNVHTDEIMVGYRKTDDDIPYLKNSNDFRKEFELIGEIDDTFTEPWWKRTKVERIPTAGDVWRIKGTNQSYLIFGVCFNLTHDRDGQIMIHYRKFEGSEDMEYVKEAQEFCERFEFYRDSQL